MRRGDEDLRQPAQRGFVTCLAGAAKRLDERSEIDEIVARQMVLGHERPFEAAKHADAEIVENAAVGEHLPTEFAGIGADIASVQLDRRKESGKGRRRGDRHRHGGEPDFDLLAAERAPRLPPHHDQAVSAERREATLAQVGGEDVQHGPLGKLEQAGIAVEGFLVVVLEQSGAGEPAVRIAQQPPRPAEGHREGKAAHDPVAHVHPHEGEEFGRSGVELVRRAVVAIPVEGEMAPMMLPPETDVMWLTCGKMARIPQEADQAKVIETRPESAAGQGETDLLHDETRFPNH